MKVGLIDIDSKIPNLALMKLSAFYKTQGYEVELTLPLFAENYDLVFASKVFDYSYMPILPDWVNLGGSGIDLKSKLKDQIEHIMPDYSLYLDVDYSLGFTTRGCNRKCQFCIVPEKEGNIRFNANITEFYNKQHEKIILLDNNIFALESHFKEIADQLAKLNLKVDFNQGLDIRLLDRKKAKILKSLKPVRFWRFAFDNLKEKSTIKKGLKLLKEVGLSKKEEIIFYLLIGFYEKNYKDAIDSALERIDLICNEFPFDVFAMPYNNDPQYRNFIRWVNRKAIFQSVKWEDYKKR